MLTVTGWMVDEGREVLTAVRRCCNMQRVVMILMLSKVSPTEGRMVVHELGETSTLASKGGLLSVVCSARQRMCWEDWAVLGVELALALDSEECS